MKFFIFSRGDDRESVTAEIAIKGEDGRPFISENTCHATSHADAMLRALGPLLRWLIKRGGTHEVFVNDRAAVNLLRLREQHPSSRIAQIQVLLKLSAGQISVSYGIARGVFGEHAEDLA